MYFQDKMTKTFPEQKIFISIFRIRFVIFIKHTIKLNKLFNFIVFISLIG